MRYKIVASEGYLTIKEAAELMECNPSSVRKLIANGTIKGVRVRNFAYEIPRQSIEGLKFVKARLTPKGMLSLRKAAQLLNVTSYGMQKILNEGRLPAIDLDGSGAGRRRLVYEADVLALAAERSCMTQLEKLQRVYFVGIGGIGMSSLARYFVQAGMAVAGYDRSPSSITQALSEIGVRVHFDDDVALIPPEFLNPEGTLLVYTPAIPAEHSELQHLRSLGLMPLKRAQVLGIIARRHRTLGVAGTHGKTTTSTMLGHLLGQSSMGCSALVGGISKNFGSNLLLADRGHKLMVVEADEFDRSFLSLSPSLAIITSTDPDHLDIYGTHQRMLEAFEQFTARIEPGGILIIKHGLCLQPSLAPKVRTITYGLNEQADVHPINVELHNGLYRFDLHTPQGDVSQLLLGVPGLHNLENATAAAAAALLMGLKPDELRRGLSTFAGVVRRFDVHYRSERAAYIDDYAHHPDEIRATVRSLREAFPGRRLTGVFQPHLYSRTRDFARDFALALDALDQAYLLDIYPARELPIEGVSSCSIAELMQHPAPVLSRTELLEQLRTKPLDVLVTMGAGDIDRLAPELTTLLEQRFGPNQAEQQQEPTRYTTQQE